MTSYFDDLRREVRGLPEDDRWLDALAAIEERVIGEVSLVTGDREFPDDLRERIQGAIATDRVRFVIPSIPNQEAIDYALCCRESVLLDRLHDLFHDVARRRIRTRFGMFSDHPAGILRVREAHDLEAGR